MKMRTRKLIGTIATVVFITIYALVVMAIGAGFIIGRGMMFELPFYIVGGFAWLPVVMMLIRWMAKPDAASSH